MEEIKFKGKNKFDKWLIGDLIHNRGHVFIAPLGIANPLAKDGDFEVDENTVGQYTGLKDKNDKEIYEGDIIHIKEYKNKGIEIFQLEAFEALKEFNINDCKGTLENEYTSEVEYKNGGMIVNCDETTEMSLSCLFGDMRTSSPIFEFEIVGNIYDNPDLLENK